MTRTTSRAAPGAEVMTNKQCRRELVPGRPLSPARGVSLYATSMCLTEASECSRLPSQGRACLPCAVASKSHTRKRDRQATRHTRVLAATRIAIPRWQPESTGWNGASTKLEDRVLYSFRHDSLAGPPESCSSQGPSLELSRGGIGPVRTREETGNATPSRHRWGGAPHGACVG